MKSKFVFLDFLLFTLILFCLITNCASGNVKKSAEENRDDNGETSDETKDESLEIPAENDANKITCTRRQNSQMHEIRAAQHKQFPFMVAVMSQKNEYLCSGSLVSNGLVLTTAHCTQQPVSYVLINTTNDKRDDTTISLHVIKTERFPTYSADSVASKDVGMLYTEKQNNSVATKIKLSNYTNPILITDMECIGFGLNADVGQTKELQYIGVESRTPIEFIDTLKAYFDCVETKVVTCFKDTGGPAILNNELIGIVTKGQDECDKEISGTYAINKRMVDILPTFTFKSWLDEKIQLNEEKQPVALVTYPLKPQRPLHKMTSLGIQNQVLYMHSIVSTFLIAFH